MLIINTPTDNLKERKYIIHIIFNEFLDIEYCHKTGSSNWDITLDNNHKLIIEDHFFSKNKNDLDYLMPDSLPTKIEYTSNDFIIGRDIPIIFGNSSFNITDSSSITCGIDVFASIYFMISRWEEYVTLGRDIHDRFPATESISYKNGFLNRPIVDEYIEMLMNMFLYLGFNKDRKLRKKQLVLTHDIDRLYMWKNWLQVLRVAIGDILKRKSINLAKERFSEYNLIKSKKINDPYDTFDHLMNISDEYSLKSHFYFMSGDLTKYNNRYRIDEPKCIELISKIKKRGHIIGFHPSYNAYNDSIQFKKEKEKLEYAIGEEIREGRGHYLRFEVPTTWQIWENSGMKIDSTCGYADRVGFRCGTGQEYSVFNILTREKLKLKERPLLLMDTTLFCYQKLDQDIIRDLVINLSLHTNMFTVLWHNTQIQHMNDYEKLLSILYKS